MGKYQRKIKGILRLFRSDDTKSVYFCLSWGLGTRFAIFFPKLFGKETKKERKKNQEKSRKIKKNQEKVSGMLNFKTGCLQENAPIVIQDQEFTNRELQVRKKKKTLEYSTNSFFIFF